MSRSLQRVTLQLIAILVLPISLFAGTEQRDAELLKVRESVWRAWFAGDVAQLRQLVPADTIVISAGDKEWKNQAKVQGEAAQFHASGAKLIRLEFPKTTIQHFGNVAIVCSEYVLEIESGGSRSVSSGRATEIFVRRNGVWINPGWHTDAEK
jgi:ketosteroid isomerase-like protein